MAKEMKFDSEAREALLKGVEKVNNAVKVTLGPSGLNVAIAEGNKVNITKDGVSVSKSIELSDEFENQGVLLAKEVATKTVDQVGDGTTSSTILAYAIAKEGMKNVAAGANPTDVKIGIDKTVAAIVEQLDKNSIKVNDKKSIKQVGTISANGDEEIGELLAEAMEKVGNDGVITIDESKTSDTVLDVVEGMQFNNGYLSPYFATNDKMECILENPFILMYNHKISSFKDIMPHLEYINAQHKPLVIIAEDVDAEALGGLVVNKLRGALQVVAVKAPGYGDSRTNNLKDIAVLTGGVAVSDEVGMKLSESDSSEILGQAKTVKITKDTTTIVEGAGSPESIKETVEQMKAQLSATESKYEQEKLKERIAKLAGGVAVIKVGAATETEMKEKKDRVDDALHATRAAVEEGIVAGGGTALIRAVQSITLPEFETADQRTGANIILRAIEEPLRQIVSNAGKEASVIVNKVKELSGNIGYNAKTHVYEDLVESGVIDPVKVTKSALKNAASIASMILTTNCVIVEKKEKDCHCNDVAMPMGMPGMM